MTKTIVGKKTRALLFATLYVGLGLHTASAGDTMWIDEFSNFIETVDVQTGAVTAVGNAFPLFTGREELTGIAFDPNEHLFGITADSLYRLNKSDGKAFLVGSFGSFVGDAAGLFGLTFGQDGSLYALGAKNSEFSGYNLYTINTVTGKATLLGDIGELAYPVLAFADNKLYTIADIVGASTRSIALEQIDIADPPKSRIIPVSGIRASTFIEGLASPNPLGSTLFATTGLDRIYSLNPSTGHFSFVSSLKGGQSGAVEGTSFVTESVPEPSTIACVCLAAGVLAVWFAPRKRKFSHGEDQGARNDRK